MFRSLFYSAAVGALICMPFVQADEAEFKSFVAKYQDNTKSDLASTYGQCTYDNAARRREWYAPHPSLSFQLLRRKGHQSRDQANPIPGAI